MIAYYVHHQGRGHLHRAQSIAGALAEPVTVLTSLPRPDVVTPFADWIVLPADDVDPRARAHDAGGALHWAPLDAQGYRDRMQVVATWLAHRQPAVVVVDVSVEITTLARTLGYPVVVVAGAGERHDRAHQLAYRLADRVLAPWPGGLYEPRHLRSHTGKTVYVGAFSRFDGQPVSDPPRVPRVLLLMGAGGAAIGEADVAGARRHTAAFRWTTPGFAASAWSHDMWPLLCGADVVVTHAGMNAVAEVAAARRSAVVVPQVRPFGEQAATGRVLRRHRLATVLPRWPAAREWSGLLADAMAADAQRWSRWNDGDGAVRAAEVIDGLLARR